MFVTITDFVREWNWEATLTQKVLDGLSDESLKQQVYPEGRTLGRIAWHFTTNIPEYLAHFGLKVETLYDSQTVPSSAQEIADAFRQISSTAIEVITQQWNDDTLKEVQSAFGRKETNAQILMGLIKHVIHHRGQITILMRQAGIKPFGVYGPPKEDWIHLGVDTPPL